DWPVDQTVMMHNQIVCHGHVTDPGRINEFIGRFYRGPGQCSEVLSLGSNSVICVGPGYFTGGSLQGWHNGLAVSGGHEELMDFAYGQGQYVVHVEPDRPENGELYSTNVCNAYPGKLVIKNPPTSATTLVAQR